MLLPVCISRNTMCVMSTDLIPIAPDSPRKYEYMVQGERIFRTWEVFEDDYR